MPNICFLCASDEGIFLEISDDKTFFHKIEACLRLKASKKDALSDKICHKCAYEIDKCYDFVHKFQDLREKLKEAQKRKSNCFFCQEPGKKGYFFNLKRTKRTNQKNQLKDAFDKIDYLFDELSDETDIFICLVCRYSIDLVYDLKIVSEEVTGKLHKVSEGIKVDRLAKTETTIVRRKTTRVRGPRIELQTTSDTESDSNIMARNSRKVAASTSDKAEKKTRNHFCNECHSEIKKCGDMFRIHRTGRTLCKVCCMSMDSEKTTERNKRKRNASEAVTLPCKVFVKDVLAKSPVNASNYQTDSSGNESRSSTKTKAQLKQLPENTRMPSTRKRNAPKAAIETADDRTSRSKRATTRDTLKLLKIVKKEPVDVEEEEKISRPPKVRKKETEKIVKQENQKRTTSRKNSNFQIPKLKRDRSSSLESIASTRSIRSTRRQSIVSVDLELPKRSSRKRTDSVSSVTSVTSTASTRRGTRVGKSVASTSKETSPVGEFKSPAKVRKPMAKRTKVVKETPEVKRSLRCAVCDTEFELRDEFNTHQMTHLRNLEIEIQRVRVPEKKIVEPERLSRSPEESDDSANFVLHVRNESDSENRPSPAEQVPENGEQAPESETELRGKTSLPRGRPAKKRGRPAKFVPREGDGDKEVQKEGSENGSEANAIGETENENREPVPENSESLENRDEDRANESEVPESESKAQDEDCSEIREEGVKVPETSKVPENGNEIPENESENPESESKIPEEGNDFAEKNVPEDENVLPEGEIEIIEDGAEASLEGESGEKRSPKSRKKKSPSKVQTKRKSQVDSLKDDLPEEDESPEENVKSPLRSKSPRKNKSPLKDDLPEEDESPEETVKSPLRSKSPRKNKSPLKDHSPSKDKSPLKDSPLKGGKSPNKSPVKSESTKTSNDHCEDATPVDEESSRDLPADLDNSENLAESAKDVADDSKDLEDDSLPAVDATELVDISQESTEDNLTTDDLKSESSKDDSRLKSPRKDKSPRRKSRRNSDEDQDQDQDQDQSREDSTQKEREDQVDVNLEDMLQREELQVIDEVAESVSSTIDLEEESQATKESEKPLEEEIRDDFPISVDLEASSVQIEDDDRNAKSTRDDDDQTEDLGRDQNQDQDRNENQDDENQDRDQNQDENQDGDENQDENLENPEEHRDRETTELEAMEMSGDGVFSGMNPMMSEQSLPQEIEDVVQNGLEEMGGEVADDVSGSQIEDIQEETKAEETVSQVLQECFDLATKQKEPGKNVFFASQANLEDISNDTLNGGDMPSLETDESEVSNL